MTSPTSLIHFLLIALLACGTLWSDDALAMSEKKAIKIGKKAYEQIINKNPPYPDEELQAYVRDIGNRLASHSDLADKPWRFTVLDDPAINAFVTPGYFVYVNTGLLTYIQSEAQLAGVIGHEIGHLVRKHPDRQSTANGWTKALSTIATVLVGVTTGSGQAASGANQLGSLAGTALVRGYGRDMELEADEEGAKYLLAAGYPPEAMVDVIAVLKDQERFARLKAKEKGARPIAYHGVFSTHPRNDKRLQNAVRAVGSLDEGVVERGLDGDFEEHMEGFKFLNTPLIFRTTGSRYLNRPMDFTLAFPSGWSIKSKGSVIQAKGEGGKAVIQMRIKKLEEEITPEKYLREVRNFKTLENGESLDNEHIKGYSAIVPANSKYPARRIAVIFHKKRAFLFVAQLTDPSIPEALASFYDTLFMASFWSFRPLNEYDRSIALSRHISWYQAEQGVSFEALAAASPIKEFAEEELRLMNGYYPYGEPKAGEWLKIVR
ncbi:MAG: M48 family metalloprotease [Pseudomonadales bacterium]